MARKQSSKDNADNDDRPWNEARWAAFLRESDLRAARYAELFETLENDPDRDAKVAREMGWADRSVRNERGPGHAFDDDQDDSFDDIDPNDPDLVAEAEADTRALHAIPAYRIANRVAVAVMKALRPYEDVGDERLSFALEHALIPGAKIAGGHGIGYDDDAICGNIVCNNIALDAARKSREAFTELKTDAVLPAKVVDALLPKLNDLVQAIETRIAELRSRVTW